MSLAESIHWYNSTSNRTKQFTSLLVTGRRVMGASIPVLTAQRLVQLATFHPKLQNSWYLVAAATFSACNEPQEIPRLYHFAMINDLRPGQVSRSASKAIELLEVGTERLQGQLQELYNEPTPFQRRAAGKIREALLKSSALTGLPRAINSLQALKVTTSSELLPETNTVDTQSDKLWEGTQRPTQASF